MIISFDQMNIAKVIALSVQRSFSPRGYDSSTLLLLRNSVDDTLICLQEDVPKEENKIPWLLRFLYKDPLRLGTVKLMKELKSSGWDIFIYTTSRREVGYVKRLFKFYGIHVTKVINQEIHNREVVGDRKIYLPSKVPSKFRIDLHVDDQEFFISDGMRYGFDVVVVKPDDLEWSGKIINKTEEIKKKLNK